MHFIVERFWPTVISKIGIERVRSSVDPRTSADHAGHFARLQFAEGARIQPVLVPERQMIEQVFDGRDALLGQSLSDLRTNALHKLNMSIKLNHKAMLAGACRTGTRAFGAILVLALVVAPVGR